MKTRRQSYDQGVSYDVRNIADLMSAADAEAYRLVSDGKARPEPVRELLKSGIVRSYALTLLSQVKSGKVPQGDLEERTSTANKMLALAGMTLKPNYGTDLLRQAAELGEKYEITPQNMTATGNSKYVADKRGHTGKWRATKPELAQPVSV